MQPVLTGTRIRAGVWEGLLQGTKDKPHLEVWHLERRLQDAQVAPASAAGAWAVRVAIPVEALSDGVQTFLIRESGSDATLGHFTIIAGVAVEDDIRAEIDLLRAELDMLKRAFRRHCVETTG